MNRPTLTFYISIFDIKFPARILSRSQRLDCFSSAACRGFPEISHFEHLTAVSIAIVPPADDADARGADGC